MIIRMKIYTDNSIDAVLQLTDLKPSTQVNAAMTQLVRQVIDDSEGSLLALNGDTQKTVRDISALAETEMEKFWARLIINSETPMSALATFPYIDNYVELTKRELGLVVKSGLVIKKGRLALVIGSGPLPLSAYEMRRQAGMKVDHVDSSAEAIELSEQLGRVLRFESQYYLKDGKDVLLEKQYDLILVAALAGETVQQKQEIINNILPYLKPTGRLIVRSAQGSRELLYPAIKAAELKNVELLEEYHPNDYIINSVFIYRKAL